MGTGVGGELRLRSGGAIKLQTNSDSSTIDAFFIHAAGTVAVNTLSPDTTYKLDVAGAGQFTTSSSNQQNDFNTGQLTVRNNQSAQGAFIDFRADSATGVQGVIAKIGGFNVHSGTGYDGLLTFSTRQMSNNTMVERMRIDSAGKIGINRTPSQHPLEIQHASEPTVSLWRGSTKGGALQAQSGGTYLYSYEGAPLRFSVNSGQSFSERLRITSTGKVSIGDAATHTFSAHSEGDDLVIGGAGWRGMTIYGEAVSYTHLTLPTIYSV